MARPPPCHNAEDPMTRRGWLGFALTIGIAACSSDPSDPADQAGFHVSGANPSDQATDVAWTATVDATLSDALDPASLTPDRVELRRAGVHVPAVLTYDAGSRRIRIGAPLVPGATYQLQLSAGLRSVEGDSLAAYTWTFTTRPWAPAPLTGPGEYASFALALGPSGSIHLFGNGEYRPWSDYGASYMKYTACASDCGDPAQWGRVAVDSSYEPFSEGVFAVSGSGRVHVLHSGRLFGASDEELRYGTCASDCLSPANWTLATLDLNRGIVGFAQDDRGALHLVTLSNATYDMSYATCEAGCTDPANWTSTPIPGFGYPYDPASALQVDRNGGLHLIAQFGGELSYWSCPGNCLSAGQWTTAPVAGGYPNPTMLLDDGGGLHMLFRGGDGRLTYAFCPSDCADPGTWTSVGVAEGSASGSALAVDETGWVTALVVTDDREVSFLTCLADCLIADNWQQTIAGSLGAAGLSLAAPLRLARGADGRLLMVYTDGDRRLRYLQ
jgi:Big-like domain-containing protein